MFLNLKLFDLNFLKHRKVCAYFNKSSDRDTAGKKLRNFFFLILYLHQPIPQKWSISIGWKLLNVLCAQSYRNIFVDAQIMFWFGVTIYKYWTKTYIAHLNMLLKCKGNCVSCPSRQIWKLIKLRIEENLPS